MADESNSYRDVLSRRRFVELTGVSGAAALAGCGEDGGTDTETDGSNEVPGDGDDGSDDGGTDTPTETAPDEVQVVDFALSNWVGDDNPDNLHFNPYNTSNGFPFAGFLVREPTTKWHYGRGEYINWALTDWQMVDDNTFEFSINTDIVWANGDNLSTDDVITQLKLESALGSELWDFADSLEAVDDQTIQINLPEGGNPQLIKVFLNNVYLHTKHSEYEQYLDAVDTSGGEDYDEDLREELQTGTTQDPVVNGPFEVESVDQQRLTLARRDGYHASGNVNFSNYEMRYIGGNQQVWQELLGSNIDAVWSLFTPPRIVADFPDSVAEARIPAYWGYGLLPQHDGDHTGDLAVRKAIMHVINRQQVVQNAGPRTKKTPEIPTCISTDTQDNWIGDSMGDFESYGKAERQTERATEILENAGYSKNDGTWEDSDGNAVSLDVLVPAGWSDWVAATRTITDQLSQFGFKSEVDAQGGAFWDRIFGGDFELSAWFWLTGGVNGAQPYFNARHQLMVTEGQPPFNYEHSDETAQKIQDLSVATDSGEIESLVHDLAMTSNEELPMLPMTEKDDQSFVNGSRLNIPEDGSEKYQVKWPSAWLVRNGDIAAKEQ